MNAYCSGSVFVRRQKKWITRTFIVGAIAVAALSACPAPPAAAADALERQRTQLEIDRLKRDAGWQAAVQRWLPAVSVLIAATVGGYGVWRYFDERTRSREIRIAEGVAYNRERLVDRPADGMGSSARLIAALQSIDAFAPRGAGGAAERHRRTVTEVVTALVRDDVVSFARVDDARVPIICLDHWAELQDVLRRDPEMCRTVLGRYVGAVRDIASRAPAYVKEARQCGTRYLADPEVAPADELRFAVVATGFRRYVEVVADEEVRQEAVIGLSEVAPALGEQVSGPPPRVMPARETSP